MSPGPSWFESYNPTYIGGDIAGGAHEALQLVFRPDDQRPALPHARPLAVPVCSASTPPGAGVHGMCGHHAAKAALRTVLA